MPSPFIHNADPGVVDTYAALARAEAYVNDGYIETNMQYNIGRLDGDYEGWAFDLIHPETGERLLVTPESSDDSERLVTAVLGEHSTLSKISQNENVNVYEVPRGARPLIGTLRSAPYKNEYMDTLHERALRFVRALSKLDSGLFGINMNRIAITYNGGENGDDAYLTVVPPLLPPAESVNPDYDYSLLAAMRHGRKQMRAGTLTMLPDKSKSIAQFKAWVGGENPYAYETRPLAGLLKIIGVGDDGPAA